MYSTIFPSTQSIKFPSTPTSQEHLLSRALAASLPLCLSHSRSLLLFLGGCTLWPSWLLLLFAVLGRAVGAAFGRGSLFVVLLLIIFLVSLLLLGLAIESRLLSLPLLANLGVVLVLFGAWCLCFLGLFIFGLFFFLLRRLLLILLFLLGIAVGAIGAVTSAIRARSVRLDGQLIGGLDNIVTAALDVNSWIVLGAGLGNLVTAV